MHEDENIIHYLKAWLEMHKSTSQHSTSLFSFSWKVKGLANGHRIDQWQK